MEVRSFSRDKEAYIVVSDTGSGIPKEELPYIFDRFYRVDKARRRESGDLSGGAGLGLAIASETAARMGGTLTVESEPGKGSQFTASFPAIKEGTG